MKRFLAAFPLFAGWPWHWRQAPAAQVKELPGDTVTVSGTVEAIDQTSRALTFKNEAGELVTIDVSPEVKRFSEIKVGDKITARYYDNVTVRLKKPGEASVNKESAAATPGKGAKPGATVATQRTMTAVVDAIDPNVPSISFKGPQGWKYSRRVLDKNVLTQVKVGDQVDFTWTDAMIVSVSTQEVRQAPVTLLPAGRPPRSSVSRRARGCGVAPR